MHASSDHRRRERPEWCRRQLVQRSRMSHRSRNSVRAETMGTRRLQIASLVVATVVMIFAVSSVRAGQEREDYNSGSYLYRAFCVSCHGIDGKGKGPVADTLARPVPDLTLLTRNAGGTFPRGRVLEILEGKRLLPGHAGSAMPRWSDVFTTLERDPRAVQKRLTALVEQIESLQTIDRR